jgi:hypothetical protein
MQLWVQKDRGSWRRGRVRGRFFTLDSQGAGGITEQKSPVHSDRTRPEPFPGSSWKRRHADSATLPRVLGRILPCLFSFWWLPAILGIPWVVAASLLSLISVSVFPVLLSVLFSAFFFF